MKDLGPNGTHFHHLDIDLDMVKYFNAESWRNDIT